jgi:hypothetical protein
VLVAPYPPSSNATCRTAVRLAEPRAFIIAFPRNGARRRGERYRPSPSLKGVKIGRRSRVKFGSRLTFFLLLPFLFLFAASILVVFGEERLAPHDQFSPHEIDNKVRIMLTVSRAARRADKSSDYEVLH